MIRTDISALATAVAISLLGAQIRGQTAAPPAASQNVAARAARSSPPLPALPQSFDTTEYRIRVSAVTRELSHPWGLAFLPDGSILITERPGRLRIIRNGVLDPKPIPGVPAVHVVALVGLMDIVIHPKFSQNQLVYLTYAKADGKGLATTALARGRFDGHALVDVKDIFVADTWSTSTTNFGGRLLFDHNGFLYFSVGERQETARAQNPGDYGGKVLRLRDDGSVPMDNPFVGKAGYKPEIYSLGHRNPQGLAEEPSTGAIWENEHGPQGGDELNVLRPGGNYGWPIVTFGIDYSGAKLSELTSRADLDSPFVYWVPSIAVSGLAFYTGDKFPAWRGSVFVGGLRMGRTRGTGQLQRIVLSPKGEPIQREPLLVDLHQRIRGVYQGPDGFLYVLTEEDGGALLKIEPVDEVRK